MSSLFFDIMTSVDISDNKLTLKEMYEKLLLKIKENCDYTTDLSITIGKDIKDLIKCGSSRWNPVNDKNGETILSWDGKYSFIYDENLKPNVVWINSDQFKYVLIVKLI